MADNLDDGEFWLPSQFLSDTDEDDSSTNCFSSDLGSPVDSVTETESDEDEFLADLTHQIARSSLLHDSSPSAFNKKSTCLVSPPSAPAKVVKVGDGATLALPQQHKGTGYFDSNRPLVCPPRNHTNPNFHGGFPHESELSQQQLQAYQFQHLWRQEMMMKKQTQVISNGRPNIQNRPPGLSASAWPPLQHPLNRQNHLPGSGMRAVFLGNPASKRESTGTGVFLPRRVNPTEPAKNNITKPGCSTVLVPEKVVQPLNNINAAQSRRHPQPRFDTNGKFRSQSKGFQGPKRSSESNANHEIRLPSEWTY